MSEAAAVDIPADRLEEAKNIVLGWRIVGQVEPQSLEEAKDMLQGSVGYATRVYELLSTFIRENDR